MRAINTLRAGACFPCNSLRYGLPPTSKARERLLSKVKADQERLKQLDARMEETTEVVERMKQRLGDLDSDLKADRKGDVSQNKVDGSFVYCIFL